MKRLVLVFLLLLGSSLAQTSLDDLNAALEEAQQLRQERLAAARKAEARLKELGAEVQRLLRELDALGRDITRLENEKREIELSIEALGEQIADAEKEIAQYEAQLERLKGRMTRLVEKLYRERAGRYLPLLRAESLADLLMRAGWIQYLGASDVRLVETLTALVHELQAARDRLAQLVAELASKKADLEARIAALEAKRARYKAVLAQLERQKAGEEVRLVELNKAAEELERQMNDLAAQIEAERKRLEAERRRREQENRAVGETFTVPRVLVGELLFPIPGGRIVTPFGAAGNTWQVIRASQDYAAVRAAADGRVLATAYYSNYGWNVIILHSNELMTRYTNLQQPLVRTGDAVKQGQIIGYLGISPLIPPNEMWFSVLVTKKGKTVAVDPSRYY